MSLLRSQPSLVGVDAAGISTFLDTVAAARIELHSLMVVRHGKVIAEGWWDPYSAQRPHLLYSLTKTFTSTAIGLLVADGFVDLDCCVLDYLNVDGYEVSPAYRQVTLRHCLTMSTGHTQDFVLVFEQDDESIDNVLGRILSDGPTAQPGSVFCYNQRATYLLGEVVRSVTGESLRSFLRRRLLQPLGIDHEVAWHVTSEGAEYGFSGLHACTEDVAKLGLLWLNRGIYQGQRLLPQTWFDEATDFSHLPFPGAGGPDWAQGYGFQVWKARHGYRGDGAFGQFAVILPEQDVVVAITSECDDMQAILDALWENLLPACAAPGTSQADARLAMRLAEAHLPALASVSTGQEGQWTLNRSDIKAVTACQVTPQGDGWRLNLDGVGAIEVGDGQWRESNVGGVLGQCAVAASGGWVNGTFRAELRLLETPHVLVFRAGPADASLTWRRQPLSQPYPFGVEKAIAG